MWRLQALWCHFLQTEVLEVPRLNNEEERKIGHKEEEDDEEDDVLYSRKIERRDRDRTTCRIASVRYRIVLKEQIPGLKRSHLLRLSLCTKVFAVTISV